MKLLAFEASGPELMVPLVAAIHAISYRLHRDFLVAWAGDVLVPFVSAAIGVSDAEKLAWACVLAGVGLVLFTFEASLVYSSAVEIGPAGEGYDVLTPRLQESRKRGLGARLFGAHCNANEDLATFGIAVACASALKADGAYVASLACLHVAYRCVHWVGYVINVPALRAMAYIMGFQTAVFIMLNAIFDHKL